MFNVSCEELIAKLEIENPGHQIFKNLKEEFCDERVTVIKNLAVLADYYKIDDLTFAITQYISACNLSKNFDIARAIIFEAKIEEYTHTFRKILKIFSKIEEEGIFEMPISNSYGIEEWVVRWNEYNSYSFLPKLKKWFEIDYDKLIAFQNASEISYDTAISILENIEYWKHETLLLDMIGNLQFSIIEENKVYTSLELYLDVLGKSNCEDLIESIEVFISSVVSITSLKKKVKKYWEKYEYDKAADLYFSSSGDEISYDEALMLGVTPKAKKFFKNSMLEILHEYNLQIKLPKYISCQI